MLKSNYFYFLRIGKQSNELNLFSENLDKSTFNKRWGKWGLPLHADQRWVSWK